MYSGGYMHVKMRHHESHIILGENILYHSCFAGLNIDSEHCIM